MLVSLSIRRGAVRRTLPELDMALEAHDCLEETKDTWLEGTLRNEPTTEDKQGIEAKHEASERNQIYLPVHYTDLRQAADLDPSAHCAQKLMDNFQLF